MRTLTLTPLANKLAHGFNSAALADEVAQSTHGFSPAYLKELFVSAGLERAQAGAEILDDQFASAVLTQVAVLREHLRSLKTQASVGEMVGEGVDRIGIRRRD